MNRREFLQTTAGAAALSAVRPLSAARAQRSGVVGANERVRMAIIGSGGRGNQVLTSFGQTPNNVFVAACDVFKERMDSTVQKLSADGQKVDAYEDYRRVLDRKDVDAVLIATPDHWHPQITIDACAAGKDVYMEKPACNGSTIEPAAKAIEAARRYGRIVQVGTEQRSWPHFDEARALLPELGGVTHVILEYGGGGSAAVEPVAPVPEGLNWDMFQGPAPRKPYKVGRQRQWRYYWDYGGGLVTDWGVHLADTALWFMDAQLVAPRLTTGVGQFVNVQNPDPDRPYNAFTASWQYEKFVMTFSNALIGNAEFPFHGTVFIGPRGSLVVNRTGYMLRPPERGLGGGRGRAVGRGAAGAAPQPGRAPAGPPQPPIEGKVVTAGPELDMVVTATTLHVKNFLDCVKSRQKPVSDVEIGFYATLPCVLAIRAMREGRVFGWDSATMKAKAL
jgi:predicted dehydrogenase